MTNCLWIDWSNLIDSEANLIGFEAYLIWCVVTEKLIRIMYLKTTDLLLSECGKTFTAAVV